MVKVMILSDGPQVTSSYGIITRNIARQLLKKGYDVSFGVTVHRGSPVEVTIDEHKAMMYSVMPDGRGNMVHLDKAIDTEKPDVTLFIRDAAGLNVRRLDSALTLAKYPVRGIKRISYIPIMYQEMIPDTMQGVVESSDYIVPFTDIGRSFMMNAGTPYNIIADTIPPGYNKASFHPGKSDYFGVEQDVFTFIGRLDSQRKNLTALFEAMRIYHMEFDRTAFLYIHYGGRLAYELATLQKIYDLTGSLLRPNEYSPEWGEAEANMGDIIRSSRAVVNASGAEGFNMPFLEAIACGVPAVGTYMPFYEWSHQILQAKSVRGSDGLFSLSYSPDPYDFAQKMHDATKLKVDPTEVSGLEWTKVGEKWSKLIESIL